MSVLIWTIAYFCAMCLCVALVLAWGWFWQWIFGHTIWGFIAGIIPIALFCCYMIAKEVEPRP